MRLWREYLLIGGIPQAVNEYVQSRDFNEVDYIKRGIIDFYLDDMGKLANGDTGKLRSIFSQIPGQLSKHEKKFTLASINREARSAKIGRASCRERV